MGSVAYVKLNFMLKAEAAVFYHVSQNNPGAPLQASWCSPASQEFGVSLAQIVDVFQDQGSIATNLKRPIHC